MQEISIPPTNRVSRRLSGLILSGFALLILLMGLFTALAVRNIGQLEERMHEIVEHHNRKIQLATDLQEASHNRHNSLVYMVLSSDPFERDEHFQQYIKWGYHVGKARNELKAMPLDKEERDNLEVQNRLVELIVVSQEQISDLAARDRQEEARNLLEFDLQPLNLQFTTAVEALRREARDHISEALHATHQATSRARNITLALGGGLLLLSLVMAFVTYWLLRRYARTVCQQMLQLENTGRKLQHQATHDPLTGLANRLLFNHRLAEDIARAEEDGLEMLVAYIDLDKFKPVNDRYGHATGDELLKEVARRLRATVRSNDTVARLGGDEFALILNGIGDEVQQGQFFAKIEQAISVPADLGTVTLTPRCSIGYAVYPRDGQDIEALLHAADTTMYRVKAERKTAR